MDTKMPTAETYEDVKKPQLATRLDGEILLVDHDHVRKIPIPTTDPNDPLNFNKWRKLGIIITCCWFSTFSILSISGTGTIMATLAEVYAPLPFTTVNELSTYPTMVMAFGSLVLLPLSFVFGRRPIFLLAVIIALICQFTAGASHSYDSHLASKIVSGLGTGAVESLLPLIIADITFVSERSFFFGLYWSVQQVLSTAITISLSYLVAATSWRWFYWLFGILLAVSTVMVFFLVPETKYYRSPTSVNGQVIHTDEFGTTHILTDEEARERLGEVVEVVPHQAPKRNFLAELKPWSDITPHGLRIWLVAYKKILKCCSSPGVIFALMCSSISLGTAIGITLVYSTVLEEFYGWSAASVGLFNVGVIPAALVAMFYSGWCADKINIWLARRNGGVHKPEHHLIHLIIPCITGVIGIVSIAICCQYPKDHSAWGLLIGWAIYEFSFTCVIITSTTFASEVIPDNPGAAMVVVVGGKNIVSFGASYGLVPMVESYSYLTSFMILMGIFIGIFLLGVPVYFLNSKWRKVATK